MLSIQLQVVDDVDIYSKVADAKRQPNRGLMHAAWPNISIAYTAYSYNAPNLTHLPDPGLTATQKSAMIHAFEVDTEAYEEGFVRFFWKIFRRRFVLTAEWEETSTLDHYLPKEQNPQFAIFSENLVPACSRCNTLKRDKIVDEGIGVRLFLHPYFDNIPISNFLSVNIGLRK